MGGHFAAKKSDHIETKIGGHITRNLQIFETSSAIFDNYHMGAFINYFLRYQVQPQNLNSLIKNLESLSLMGLSKERLIKFLKNPRSFYGFYEDTMLSPLMKRFESESDRQTSIIILILVLKLIRHPRVQAKKQPLSDLVKVKAKKAFLKEVDKINDFEKKIQYIMKNA